MSPKPRKGKKKAAKAVAKQEETQPEQEVEPPKPKEKGKRQAVTLHQKLHILKLSDKNKTLKQNDLVEELKNRFGITSTQQRNKDSTRNRSATCPKLEEKLYKWFIRRKGAGVTRDRIKEYAKKLEQSDKTIEEEISKSKFSFSQGWYQRFKNRHGLKQIQESSGGTKKTKKSGAQGEDQDFADDSGVSVDSPSGSQQGGSIAVAEDGILSDADTENNNISGKKRKSTAQPSSDAEKKPKTNKQTPKKKGTAKDQNKPQIWIEINYQNSQTMVEYKTQDQSYVKDVLELKFGTDYYCFLKQGSGETMIPNIQYLLNKLAEVESNPSVYIKQEDQFIKPQVSYVKKTPQLKIFLHVMPRNSSMKTAAPPVPEPYTQTLVQSVDTSKTQEDKSQNSKANQILLDLVKDYMPGDLPQQAQFANFNPKDFQLCLASSQLRNKNLANCNVLRRAAVIHQYLNKIGKSMLQKENSMETISEINNLINRKISDMNLRFKKNPEQQPKYMQSFILDYFTKPVDIPGGQMTRFQADQSCQLYGLQKALQLDDNLIQAVQGLQG